MVKKNQLITGIDVGTTKVCTTIASMNRDGLRILGTGWSPSKGLKKGIVVNLSETISSIKASLEEAEKEADAIVESAFVSVGGSFIRSVNCTGTTDVRNRNQEVSSDDISRAVADAQDFEVPESYEVVHVLTQTFALDGQDGIIDPVGMSGRHLSVHLHLVLNASPVVQNIINAINKAGVVVDGVVMHQLASAEAVLTGDEKELGTVLVDIGGGTIDLAIYTQGTIWHSEVLPMGGDLITKDIAIGLKAPLEEAEELKRTRGSVFPESVPEEEMVEVGEVGTGRQRTMSRRLLCQIIQARCDEVLQALTKIIQKTGVQPNLVTGMVITGGGSLLDGITERAEQLLEMPVRLGYPAKVVEPRESVYHPAFSTALGLLKYAGEVQGGEQAVRATRSAVALRQGGTGERLKNWIFERIG